VLGCDEARVPRVFLPSLRLLSGMLKHEWTAVLRLNAGGRAGFSKPDESLVFQHMAARNNYSSSS
jgi:hypothetical protein